MKAMPMAMAMPMSKMLNKGVRIRQKVNSGLLFYLLYQHFSEFLDKKPIFQPQNKFVMEARKHNIYLCNELFLNTTAFVKLLKHTQTKIYQRFSLYQNNFFNNRTYVIFSFTDLICFNCRRPGHKKWKCPMKDKDDRQRPRRRGRRGGNNRGKSVNIYL